MKTKAEDVYLSPTVQFTRVVLEESVVAVQSPVSGVTLEGWDDNNGADYGNGDGDSGNIYVGL